MKYIAIAINKEYWVCLSKPVSKRQTELFRDCVLCRDEIFAIKTEKEIDNYKKVIR